MAADRLTWTVSPPVGCYSLHPPWWSATLETCGVKATRGRGWYLENRKFSGGGWFPLPTLHLLRRLDPRTFCAWPLDTPVQRPYCQLSTLRSTDRHCPNHQPSSFNWRLDDKQYFVYEFDSISFALQGRRGPLPRGVQHPDPQPCPGGPNPHRWPTIPLGIMQIRGFLLGVG